MYSLDAQQLDFGSKTIQVQCHRFYPSTYLHKQTCLRTSDQRHCTQHLCEKVWPEPCVMKMLAKLLCGQNDAISVMQMQQREWILQLRMEYVGVKFKNGMAQQKNYKARVWCTETVSQSVPMKWTKERKHITFPVQKRPPLQRWKFSVWILSVSVNQRQGC